MHNEYKKKQYLCTKIRFANSTLQNPHPTLPTMNPKKSNNNIIIHQLKHLKIMKKTRLYFLLTALLFAGSAMAQTTVFHWQMSGTSAPALGTAITATGGTITPSSSGTDAFSVESAAYVTGTPADMQAKDGKGLKSGKNVQYLVVTPETPLKAGDSIMICGYLGWKISSTAEQTGDVSASVATGADKNSYAVGKMELTKDVDVLYLSRAAGNSTAISAIKIVRPAPKTEPWLTLSATEVELAVTPFAASVEAKVTLKGGNLTAGDYTLTVPEVAGLTVAPTSVKVEADGTVNQDITLTYTSDVDVLKTKAQLSVTINEILAQLDITYSALLTVDAITIFHWQMSGKDAPVAGTALTATGGTITPGTTDSNKTFSVESAGYVGGVPDDMKAKDGKGVKFGGNALSFKVALADNATFKAGDIVSICGYLPWKISSTSEHKGDLAESIATGTNNQNYAVGQVVLTADADTLYLMRAQGSSTAVAAIKVERPTECADAEVALPENPDIEVANSALTITAPTLENPNGLVVKYVSSDAEVVAVDENTGALTKGTKTGMATITISWVRQTINTVRHCAGELAYTVTVKDGAPES